MKMRVLCVSMSLMEMRALFVSMPLMEMRALCVSMSLMKMKFPSSYLTALTNFVVLSGSSPNFQLLEWNEF